MEKFKITILQIIIISYREFLKWWRNKFKVITTVIQPFIWTIFFGLGLGKIVNINEIARAINYQGEISYLLFIFPGMISTTVIFISFNFGHSFVEEKERGFLRPLILSPTPDWVIVLGKILSAGFIGALQGLIVNLLGFIYFKEISITFLTFPALLVLGILTATLGIFLGLFFKKAGSYDILLFYVIIPAILLSGAYFPVELTPLWMIRLAQFNPFYYGVETVKKVFVFSLSLEKDFSNLKELIITKGIGIFEGALYTFMFIAFFFVLINVIIKNKSLD